MDRESSLSEAVAGSSGQSKHTALPCKYCGGWGEKSMTSCSAPSVSTSETSSFYYSKQQEPTEPSVLWICAGPAVKYTERAAPVHRSVQRRRGGASARLGGMADGDAVLSVEWDSGDEGLAMDPEKTLTFCHGLQTMEVMHCTALHVMRTQLSAAVLQSNMLPSACGVVDKQQWPRHIIIIFISSPFGHYICDIHETARVFVHHCSQSA